MPTVTYCQSAVLQPCWQLPPVSADTARLWHCRVAGAARVGAECRHRCVRRSKFKDEDVDNGRMSSTAVSLGHSGWELTTIIVVCADQVQGRGPRGRRHERLGARAAQHRNRTACFCTQVSFTSLSRAASQKQTGLHSQH